MNQVEIVVQVAKKKKEKKKNSTERLKEKNKNKLFHFTFHWTDALFFEEAVKGIIDLHSHKLLRNTEIQCKQVLVSTFFWKDWDNFLVCNIEENPNFIK